MSGVNVQGSLLVRQVLQQDAELKALKTKMTAIEEIIKQAAEASQGGKKAVEQVIVVHVFHFFSCRTFRPSLSRVAVAGLGEERHVSLTLQRQVLKFVTFVLNLSQTAAQSGFARDYAPVMRSSPDNRINQTHFSRQAVLRDCCRVRNSLLAYVPHWNANPAPNRYR